MAFKIKDGLRVGLVDVINSAATIIKAGGSATDSIQLQARIGGSYTGIFTPATLTTDRTWTLPDKTGTIALTSDIISAITVADDNTTSTTLYPIFTGTTTGTISSVKVDSSTSPLSYVPSTGILTAAGFSGSGAYLTNSSVAYTALSTMTSANLASLLTDETGSGTGSLVVFNKSPTFDTSIDGSATFGAFASSTTLTLGYTGTAASTTNISTGTTATATTKTINIGTGGATGSTTTINIGSASGGTTTVNNNLTVTGDLTVNGTTTTINSTTITVDDILIELGSVTSPSNVTAEGGGIKVLDGAAGKTIVWNATSPITGWTSSESFNLASTKAYYINGAIVLSATTLGSAVVNSSLTKIGLSSAGVVKSDASGNLSTQTAVTGVTSITGSTSLDLLSTTTGIITLDSGTTGAINIGTGANAKVITVGNSTGATSINVNSGTGGITLLTATTGAVSIDSGSTGNINIGTGANAKTITVGNSTGATSVNVNSGTGGITLLTATTGAVSIDSGTTGAVNLGTNANAKPITIGNTTGATSISINSGTGGISLLTGTTGTLGLDTGGGAINLGTGAATKAISIGNITGTTTVAISGGNSATAITGRTAAGGTIDLTTGTTGAIIIDSGTTGSISIGTNANGKIISIGNTTANTAVNISSGGTGATTITGSVKLPTVGTSGFVKLGAGGVLSADTNTYLTSYTETDTLQSVTQRASGNFTDRDIQVNASNFALAPATTAKVWTKAITPTTISVNTTVPIDTWDKTLYRSCKYSIQITQGAVKYQLSEVTMVHDGSVVYLTEYAVLENNAAASIPCTYTAAIAGSTMTLSATITDAATTNANLLMVRTLYAV